MISKIIRQTSRPESLILKRSIIEKSWTIVVITIFYYARSINRNSLYYSQPLIYINLFIANKSLTTPHVCLYVCMLVCLYCLCPCMSSAALSETGFMLQHGRPSGSCKLYIQEQRNRKFRTKGILIYAFSIKLSCNTEGR